MVSDFESARRYFSKATTLNHRFAPAWVGFGHAFAAQDESDQAIAAYRTAHGSEPTLGSVLWRYGTRRWPPTAPRRASFRARTLRGSAFAWSTIPSEYRTQCGFSPVGGVVGIGMEYLRTNHLPLAMHYIKQAHAIAPHEPAVLHELGVLHYASGEYAEAADYFTRVAEHELPRRGRAPHLSPSLPIPRALDAEHVPSCLPTSTREDTYSAVFPCTPSPLCSRGALNTLPQDRLLAGTRATTTPHISPYLLISPHLSPSLPISPHLSPSLPHISPISPHLSPYLAGVRPPQVDQGPDHRVQPGKRQAHRRSRAGRGQRGGGGAKAAEERQARGQRGGGGVCSAVCGRRRRRRRRP